MKKPMFHLNLNNCSFGQATHILQKEVNTIPSYILPPEASKDWYSMSYFTKQMDKKHISNFKQIRIQLFPELKQELNEKIARNFCEELVRNFNVPAIMIFHQLTERQPHCHILFTDRQINNGEFASLKMRIFNSKQFHQLIRKLWMETAKFHFGNNN